MLHDVKIPSVGESVQQVQVFHWRKKTGEAVQRDEVIVELETDKAAVELVAPQSGVITINVPEGAEVTVGQVIATIDGEGKAETTAEPPVVATPAPEREAMSATPQHVSGMPAATRLAAESNVPIESISGTGRDGRVTKSDIISQLDQQRQPAHTEPKLAAKLSTPPPLTKPAPSASRVSERRKLSLMRQRIAQRLVEAQHTAAMLTTFNEVDMSAIMSLRASFGAEFEKKHGTKLGFMSFFIRAACEALKAYPQVNAMIDGDEIVYHRFYDIAVAVSTERGLLVPVIRDCERLSFAEIEGQLVRFATKAREGSISVDDLNGGTFSITNGGVFGSLLSTPILNHPQSAILGMHKTQKRAVVIDDQIVIRPMMYLALSYDHRIIDGKDAVGFLVAIKNFVEQPARLLMGV